MKTIEFDKEFFNIADTLSCGQVFRFTPYKSGFLIFSEDKCAYAYQTEDKTIVLCSDTDRDYFYNYFDLSADYKSIYEAAISQREEKLITAAKLGKGIRILNQNPTETLFSFIISQNNNIPRIKGIIERLAIRLGEKKKFDGVIYYSFPSAQKMAQMPEEFFKEIGLGYRAPYIKKLAEDIVSGFDVSALKTLSTLELKKRLLNIYGVGPKVCDCVSFFGFHKTDSFPVDTWIEKVYIEDFNGTLKNREKIAEYFVNRFKENSGYFQQYLFYYKRSIEKTLESDKSNAK